MRTAANWATIALLGAGAGYATTQKPLWTTGGQGSPPSNPIMADVVPTRAQQLMRLHESSPDKPFDVLIIGGGATGSGCALDASTRGLRTALIERGDWASGTSSKSTKLVHGGVRYLEKAVFNADLDQLKLVYEALHERRTLLQNAPHLSRPLPILTPCYKWWEVPYYWAGMKMYDLVAGTTNLVLSKYMAPTEALTVMPTLATELQGRQLKGGILYYDGQFDDARLNVALACSSAAAGAAVANYMECVQIKKNQEGQVIGARCRDRLTGEEVDVWARVVMNATGAFVDSVRQLADTQAEPTVTASSGSHLTLPGYIGSATTGIIIPKTADGRVVFLLPWQGHVIVGTTDHESQASFTPRTSIEERDYILATISDYLGVRVSPSDVLSAWSGFRPLPSNPAAKAKDTASIVRDHVIFMDDDGMLNVTGGKWTTYRRMAQEAVDAAVASGRLPLNTRPCITTTLPLIGAQQYRRTLHAEVAQQCCCSNPSNPAQPPLIALDTAHHLCDAYGDRAKAVLDLAAKSGLNKRLVPGHPYIEAEVLYCTQAEYCVTVEDFIARRSRLAFLDVQACHAAVPRVAAVMATALGWNHEQQKQQEAAAHQFLEACFTVGPGAAATQPTQQQAEQAPAPAA